MKKTTSLFALVLLQLTVCSQDIPGKKVTATADTVRIQPPLIRALGEVILSSRKKIIEQFPDKLVVNIENSILATGNSAIDLLRKVPGVLPDAQENILLKGAPATIFIDDKPSFLTGVDLLNYLKNLPAEEISKIEIISNPGSRYPAQGAGGIINIILKKNKMLGSTGSTVLTTGYGKYPKLGINQTFNYRNKRINMFTSVATGRYEGFTRLLMNSTIGTGNKAVLQQRDHYWHPVTVSSSIKAGADFFPDSKTTFGVLVKAGFSNQHAGTTNTTVFTDMYNQALSAIGSNKQATAISSNHLYNLNYKKQIGDRGSSITMDADWGHYSNKETDKTINYFTARPDYVFSNRMPLTITIFSLKADRVWVVDSTLRVEVGVKASRVQNDNEVIADSLRTGGWYVDSSRTNHFLYDENIYAGYATVYKTVGHFSVQAGGRLERTASLGHSLTLHRLDKKKYFNFFPAIFTTLKLKHNNTIGLNYSYRINRPDYRDLNPFLDFVDPYTYFEGNPFLRPSYVHSMELRYSLHNRLFATLGYRRASQVTARVLLQDTITKISVSREENLGSSSDWILNVSGNYAPNKWYSMDWTAAIGHNAARSFYPGYSYFSRAWNGSLSFSSNFIFTKKMKGELSGYAAAPTVTGIARVAGKLNISAALQRSLGQKATLKLAFINFIGRTEYNAQYNSDLLHIKYINQWEGRRISLACTFKFGNTGIKQTPSRSTASEEETKRVGN